MQQEAMIICTADPSPKLLYANDNFKEIMRNETDALNEPCFFIENEIQPQDGSLPAIQPEMLSVATIMGLSDEFIAKNVFMFVNKNKPDQGFRYFSLKRRKT